MSFLSNKISYIFLAALVVSVIGGIWGFGLDDELLGDFNAKPSVTTQIQNEYNVENMVEPEETDKTQTNTKNEIQSLQSAKPTPVTGTESEIESPTKEERIKDLESHTFILKGNGNGYKNTVYETKLVSLNVILRPILGSDLTKFQIVSGKLVFGINGINLENGILEILGYHIVFTLNQMTQRIQQEHSLELIRDLYLMKIQMNI